MITVEGMEFPSADAAIHYFLSMRENLKFSRTLSSRSAWAALDEEIDKCQAVIDSLLAEEVS